MESNEILKDSVAELSKNNFDDSLIKDNKIPFIIDDGIYRVRMPNQGEQSLAEHKRNIVQLDYLKQKGCITKSQLIEQLKENVVVDIDKMEEEREALTKELKKYWFMLATKDSEDKLKIAEYSDKIIKVQQNLQQLALDIATFLTPCLESRLEKFYLEQITCICAEKLVNGKWELLWKDLDEFNQADTVLSNKAVASQTWLLLNRR